MRGQPWSVSTHLWLIVCAQRPAETVNLHLWPRVKWLNSGFHFLITSTTTGNCMELITSTTTDLLICWRAHRTDHAPGVLEKGAAIVVDSVHGCQRHNFSPPVLHDTQVRRPHARIIYAIFLVIPPCIQPTCDCLHYTTVWVGHDTVDHYVVYYWSGHIYSHMWIIKLYYIPLKKYSQRSKL